MEADTNLSRLIVAIPAYNEEKTIGHVIAKVKRCISIISDCQILIVDDGSSDRTIDVAKKAGADIIVSHRSNHGINNAYGTCIRYALKYDPEVICTIDADAQFNPAEIETLTAPILTRETDVVIGSRFISTRNNKQIPILNLVTNKLMANFVSLLIGIKLHDVESGFRAISAKAARSLNLSGIGSFSHDMILDLTSKGFGILEVPVSVKYYKDRTSRVIKGLLKYGFVSFKSIVLKTLSIRKLYVTSSNRMNEAAVIYESSRVR